MPKLFASEIVIHDHETGAGDPGHGQGQRAGLPPRRRDLPEQLRRRRLAAQAAARCRCAAAASRSRSRARSAAAPQLDAAAATTTADARVHRPARHQRREPRRQRRRRRGGTDVRKVDLVQLAATSHLGSGAKVATARRSCATSARRSATSCATRAGQAREFHNYMLPVELDGQRVFLAGVRDNAGRSLPLPAHPGRRQGQLDGWLRLRARAGRPGAARAGRARATSRWPRRPTSPRWPQQLTRHRARARWRCSPAPRRRARPAADGAPRRPAGAVRLHRDQRARGRARAHLRGAAAHPQRQPVRAAEPQPASRPACRRWPPTTTTQAFMTQAVLSLSDSFFYPAPVLLQLDRLQAGAGQRVPGRARAGQDARLPGRGAADRRRLRDALHPRTPPLGLARRPGGAGGTQAHRGAVDAPGARSTPTPSSSS